VNKLFVFAHRRPELEPAAFWAAWEEQLAGPLAGAQRAVANRAIPGAHVPGLELSPFDGAIELWLDGAAKLAATAGDAGWRARLEDAAAALCGPGGTVVLCAQESPQFDRGFGAVKFIGLSRRAARFATREDWVRYWREVHGPLAHGIPEFTRHYGRYVHNYVIADPLAGSGSEPEFDGIVEEWLESVEAFAACLAEPAYLERVRPDERHFVDFSRSHMLLVSERELAV
jgi:hypothetical protein